MSGILALTPGVAAGADDPITVFRAGGGAIGITAGPDGNMWFTTIGFSVGRITPTGVVTQFPVSPPLACSAGFPSGCQGRGIVAGPDGNLWFVNYFSTPSTALISTGGVVAGMPAVRTGPQESITAGADGNLWTAGFGSGALNLIVRVTPGGEVTSFPIVSQAGDQSRGAYDLALGPDGNVWFTESYQRRIGMITPAGVIAEFPLPRFISDFAVPFAITGGPDGAVWFTACGSKGFVCRIRPDGDLAAFSMPQPDARSEDICFSPDGNLWYTEGTHNKIGRCTPSGVITEFDVPVGNGPYGVAAGPDGNIWFTIPSYGIGRLNLNIVAAQEGATPIPTLNMTGLVAMGVLLAAAGYFFLRLTNQA